MRMGRWLGVGAGLVAAASSCFYDFTPRPLAVAPGADSSTDAATGSCEGTDLTSDPRNCGACGHDCAGTACTASVCQPAVLVNHTGAIQAIEVDDARIYFATDDGTMQSCPKTGCADATPTTLGSVSDRLSQFLVRDGGAIWGTASGKIYACPGAGCGGAPTVIAKPGDTVWLVTADVTDAIYWSQGPTLLAGLDNIATCTPPACDAGTILAPATPPALAVRKGRAFFGGPDEISTCDLPGCTARTFVPTTFPVDIAIDDTDVYFIGGYGEPKRLQGVFRCALSAPCTPALVAPHSGAPARIRVDDSGIYWIDGELLQARRKGSTTDQLVANGVRPTALAVDATSLYWADATTARILRVTKP